MAEIIPSLNRRTLSRMTSGEKRVARRLQSLLEDDYLVWYDIPVGSMHLHPDFVILHPGRGLLLLEVKDWKPSNIKRISKSSVELLTDSGLKTLAHPLDQAKQYAFQVVDMLSKDPALQHQSGPHRGKLIVPYGWGAVFTNVTREQIRHAIPDEPREILLPDHLVMYQDDIAEKIEPEAFQSRLWGMFKYQFGDQLTLPQIDRIRWHMFPDIRIDHGGQTDFFADSEESSQNVHDTLPDIVRVMDIQQEQLARSLGEGHRVVHGVSGSGKTLILGYRCLYLAQAMRKPILVLCFNITLAAKLRSFIAEKGVGDHVQIYHFHDWCGQQLKTYHVPVLESDKEYFDRQVESVIQGVESGHIPRGQYGALLIDEGHDFEPEWLKLVVQMIDPETNSLLLLYDDAQSIYKKTGGLGFSLSSVGIQASGRTTILKLNYRNTREILGLAYEFARRYMEAGRQSDGDIPLVEPEAAGKSGSRPVVRKLNTLGDEASFAARCIKKWHEQGVPLNDIAILHPKTRQGRDIVKRLKVDGIPHWWLARSANKRGYDPAEEKVAVMTLHSSKGLEFPRIIVLGIGALDDSDDKLGDNARLLYVGMTRAQDYLVVTTSRDNRYSQELLEAAQR
ncbi:MAG: 3'-5' exonuclease [Gammaproteobacteria bacterium]|nr:3'-5' exonuclease [Gammaproteobacteria bacterium]